MTTKTVAIIGSGPAGLMAAFVAASAGHRVRVFEKKSGPGKKLLIAGSSGLNITYDAPLERFHEFYEPSAPFEAILRAFTPDDWREFIHGLEIATFKGTSRRYFVDGMKSSKLLSAWMKKLADLGAEIVYERECLSFERVDSEIELRFSDDSRERFSAVCFALGGGSYEETEKPLRFPLLFTAQGLKFREFTPSNVGYELDWPAGFREAAEGKPIKGVKLTTARGEKVGDLMVTRYGLEGTPIYTVGCVGEAWLDLKPDTTEEALRRKLEGGLKNLRLSPAAEALLKAFSIDPAQSKTVPLKLLRPRPLDEAISSSGGLAWEELDAGLMLKKIPGVFVAGEMLDWDAPTGGFLIQGCVSQGVVAARALVEYLIATR